ncbi:MAG: DUF4352 domain-containing protein, partial [Candidatus Nealsonbacteria bacterium]
HCQTDISIKAKKCPNCQGDLRNWFRRHIVLTVIGSIILFFIIVSAIGSGGPSKVGENSTANQESSQAQIFKIGDLVKIGNSIVTVNEIEFSDGGTYTKPTTGNEWLNLNVTIENTSNAQQYVTTLGQMFIRDGEGNSYQVAATNKMMENPGFGLDGSIIAKSKRTGWVGFEIKKGITGLKFQYNASMFGGKTITVDLGR